MLINRGMSILHVICNVNLHETPFVLLCDGQVVGAVFQFLNFQFLRGMSKTTIRAYAYDLLAFYRSLGRPTPAAELGQDDILRFLSLQRKAGAAPRSINRRFITIRSYLNFCDNGFGDRLFKTACPPFYKGRRNSALLGSLRSKAGGRSSLRVKVPARIFGSLNDLDIKRFFRGIKRYRDIAILNLMLFCGLRSCEVLALELDDVDLDDCQLRVRGKGGKERMNPMSSFVIMSLRKYLNHERPDWCSHSKCFVVLKGSRRGQPMTPAGLRRFFRYRRKVLKLPSGNAHCFRHTFCTNLIRQGVSLPVVQKLMGHSDIELTMTYVHMSFEDVAKEYQQALKVIQGAYAE